MSLSSLARRERHTGDPSYDITVSSNAHPVLLRPSSDIFIRLEAQNRGLWFPFLFLPPLPPNSYEKPSGGILKDGQLFPYLFLYEFPITGVFQRTVLILHNVKDENAAEPKKPPPENQPREITRERPPKESPETNKPSKTKTDGKKINQATNP